MKWSFWIEAYIRTHCVARGLRPLTLVAYENTLKQFHEWVQVKCYDAAGDVTNDGVNMYEYDAEGRQTGVLNSTTLELTGYVYDAEGRRIEKVLVEGWNTPNPQTVIQDEYLLGLNGEQVSVLDGNGNWQWTNVYARGKQLASYDSAGTHFTLTDWLGTKRMQLSEQISGTTATVTVGEQCTSLPYGDSMNCTGSDVNQLYFTGKERDAESGNDYFGARYYGSSMGRMLSPDPVFISLDQIYDPQGLNLYAYARNNPLTITDPTGLDFYLACQTSDHSGCGQVQNGDSKVWVQGQTVNGSFQATDVDMNKAGDASAGYHDQFGNQYSGSFDENGGVSFTNTATGATSSNSRFIDGSDETDVNGSASGAFNGIQGRFNSDCGGSCEAKGSLYDLPGYPNAVANLEKRIGASFEDNLNFFGGHGKSISFRFGDDQLTHIVNHLAGPDAGRQEVHFEGHPPGRDVVNFVLHQVDAIRDAANHQSAQEPRLP